MFQLQIKRECISPGYFKTFRIYVYGNWFSAVNNA